MKEIEKLQAGLEYNFYDSDVVALKEHALLMCNKINHATDNEKVTLIKSFFGSTKENVSLQPNFYCDTGSNIHVGEDFLTNYNVTILDIAKVNIGDNCMIGPNTLITTVGHPINPLKRRKKLAQAKPISIGNDVWIGGNVTILPGVKIGDNVVVAAGAVITKDIDSNTIVGGVPAKVLKTISLSKE